MPNALPAFPDRIQDLSDFTGSLTGGYYLQYNSGTGLFELAALTGASTNVLVNGATVGTSGVGVVAIANGTVPTSQPADQVQVVSADYASGDARVLVLTEQGRGLWLGNGTLEARAPTSGAGNSLTLRPSAAVSGNTPGGHLVLAPGSKSGSGEEGLVIVQASTNSVAKLQSWRRLDGSEMGYMRDGGEGAGPGLGFVSGSHAFFSTPSGYRLALNNVFFVGNHSGVHVMRVTAAASQSEDITQWRDAGGTSLAAINKNGFPLFRTLVEANTAGSGSPNILTATESRTVLTNEGATAENYHTLPTAAAGLDFTFVCQDADGIRITASTGDTIRFANQVSGAAGYISSNTIGSVVRLVAINATEWKVEASVGVWAIDGGTPFLATGAGVLGLANATVPSAATDTTQLLAADRTTGDSRAIIVSETGTPVWIGNGTIEAKAPTSGAGNNLVAKASDAISGNENGGSFVLSPGLKSGSGDDGKVVIRQPGGVAGTDEVQIWHDGTNGVVDIASGSLYFGGVPGSDVFSFASGGSLWIRAITICYNGGYKWWLDNNFFGGPTGFKFGLGTDMSAPDVNLTWAAAGVFRIRDATTGMGSLLCTALVEANTAGSGSPNILIADESRTVLTNEGSTAENYHTLPTAAAGLDFTFVCQDSDGIRVVANTGDTIADVGTVSGAAGYIRSSTVGSTVRLVAINATEWVVVAKQGTWTIDS